MSRARMVFALTVVGAMLVAITVQAQQNQQGRRGQRGPGMMCGPMSMGGLLRIPKVQEELKLTDDQKEQLRGLGREMRENREEAEKKLAEVLKPDQLARLKQLRLQVGGPALLTQPDVVKELGLSDEQVTKLNDLQQKFRSSMREQMQGMRDLSQEERRAKMAEMRPKMEQLQKDHMAQALEILTPAQREKLEKMKGPKADIEFTRPPRGSRRPAAGQ